MPRWRGLFFAGLTLVGAPKPKNDDSTRVLMQHHSFKIPLEYHTELEDWVVSGASLVERDRLLIHPAIPERHGLMLSRSPLLTRDFEVIFHFRCNSEKGSEKEAASADQSFAFWFMDYNASEKFDEKTIVAAKDWNKGMEDADFNFAGFQSKFNGFGVILSTFSSQGSGKATVTFVSNDGTKTMKYDVDAPTRESKAIDFRNTLNPAQLKIRVRPDSIEGHFKETPSLSWNEVFKVDASKVQLPPSGSGFLGFSAWSGTAKRADLISIVQLEVYNHDETTIGEEMRDVGMEIQRAYQEMLTADNRHFLDQKSQTDHLDRLTKMLEEHVNTAKPADQQMFADLENFGQRMNKLDENCKTLTKEIHVLVESKVPGDEVKGLIGDIVGLRRLFHQDSATHRAKINTVQKKVEAVKTVKAASGGEAVVEASRRTENIEAVVQARGSTMSWMLTIMFVVAVVFGLLLWQRMSYYEKKHFI